jgi:hypothetical protein
MVDSTAACDRVRAWPSRFRTQGAALGGAKDKPEEIDAKPQSTDIGCFSQDWLKNPLSRSRAFSSADTSTFRGVSRKILSAILCMPPSWA